MAREQTLVLTANHQSILRLLMRKGKLSRKELSQEMGITPAAITRLSAELVKSNLIKESEYVTIKNQVGRKQVLLTLQERFGYVLTINLARHGTTIALMSISGKILQQQRFFIQKMSAMSFLKMIAQEFEVMQKQLKIKSHKILAVGITVPSGYNAQEESLEKTAGLWDEDVPLAKLAKEIFPWPCYIEEQLTAFAQAHLLYMGDYGSELFCLQWGDRLASVLVFQQAIYSGYRGMAGNIAHQVVVSDGLGCPCGKSGCLINYISIQSLLESLAALDNPESTPYLHAYWQDFGAIWSEEFLHSYLKSLSQTMANLDDPVRFFFLERIGYLAQAIINATALLDPQYVVAFGSLLEHDFLYRTLVEILMQMDEKFPIHNLQRSWLSYQDATIAGLALVVQERFFR